MCSNVGTLVTGERKVALAFSFFFFLFLRNDANVDREKRLKKNYFHFDIFVHSSLRPFFVTNISQ